MKTAGVEGQEAKDEIRDEIRKAIAGGRKVQEAVRTITLKALTGRALDQAAIAKVTREVMEAVRESAEVRGDSEAAPASSRPIRDAVEGLDEALAQAAQALKLSLEEAAGRAGTFRREDLAKARGELATLERMFIETLRDTARAGRGATADILEDLARHARVSGTAVGRQLEQASPLAGSLAHAGRAQFEAGLHAAAASGAMLARIASGVLAGIADSLTRPRHKNPPHSH
jgi:hypothetical protein